VFFYSCSISNSFSFTLSVFVELVCSSVLLFYFSLLRHSIYSCTLTCNVMCYNSIFSFHVFLRNSLLSCRFLPSFLFHVLYLVVLLFISSPLLSIYDSILSPMSMLIVCKFYGCPIELSCSVCAVYITSPIECFHFLSQFYGWGFLATRYQILIPRVPSIHLPSKIWVIHVYVRGFPDDGVADFISIYISTSRVRPTPVHFHSSQILCLGIPVWAPSNSHALCA